MLFVSERYIRSHICARSIRKFWRNLMCRCADPQESCEYNQYRRIFRNTITKTCKRRKPNARLSRETNVFDWLGNRILKSRQCFIYLKHKKLYHFSFNGAIIHKTKNRKQIRIHFFVSKATQATICESMYDKASSWKRRFFFKLKNA